MNQNHLSFMSNLFMVCNSEYILISRRLQKVTISFFHLISNSNVKKKKIEMLGILRKDQSKYCKNGDKLFEKSLTVL